MVTHEEYTRAIAVIKAYQSQINAEVNSILRPFPQPGQTIRILSAKFSKKIKPGMEFEVAVSWVYDLPLEERNHFVIKNGKIRTGIRLSAFDYEIVS